MTHCLVAAGTPTTAEAGIEVANWGGNAVDAAVAAAVAAWVCEPGMTAFGSAVVGVVRVPEEPVMLVDGLTAMPGLGGHRGDPPGGQRITMDYGPGVETGVGPASVAVPGGPAALAEIQARWGKLSWGEVLKPAIRLASEGFDFPEVSAAYMPLSGEPIYDLTEGSRAIWRHADGRPREAGDKTVLVELAADLAQIAERGVDYFYQGELGARIADWIIEQGGAMSREDLAAYKVSVDTPTTVDDHGWEVATARTIGSAALQEIINGFSEVEPGSEAESGVMVRLMLSALQRRDDRLRHASASTTQICAADAQGVACSLTTSTGYGSGVIVPGTGIMLNNMLGELELLPQGPQVLEPGDRLPSNMTPMIAQRDGDVIAMGAAGADRIAPAIAQVWRGMAARGQSAEDSIRSPRFHVRTVDGEVVVDYEPGFDLAGVEWSLHAFDAPHMYFGGVQAAACKRDGTLDGGGDPRRGGAIASI